MTIHKLTNRKSKAVRTGSAVPAYFLGRSRDFYVEALAAARVSDPAHARAA